MPLKAVALLAVAPALVGAGPAEAPLPLDTPGSEAPAREWSNIGDVLPNSENCRDRIHQVREERGLPELDRETIDPDEPMLIWAIDRREDGCSVMVVKDNPEDIRPIPVLPENAPLLKPAR